MLVIVVTTVLLGLQAIAEMVETRNVSMTIFSYIYFLISICVYGMQAIAEMGMIKTQGDREQAMSEAEWKQLSNLIEIDRHERVCLSNCRDDTTAKQK